MLSESFETYIEELGKLYIDIVTHEFPSHHSLRDILLPFGGIVALAGIQREWYNPPDRTWSNTYVTGKATDRWELHMTQINARINRGDTEAIAIRNFFFYNLHFIPVNKYPQPPAAVREMARQTSRGINNMTHFVNQLDIALQHPSNGTREDPTFDEIIGSSGLLRFISFRDDWYPSVPDEWKVENDPSEEEPHNEHDPSEDEPDEVLNESILHPQTNNQSAVISREFLTRLNDQLESEYRTITLAREGAARYSDTIILVKILPGSLLDPISEGDRNQLKRHIFQVLAREAVLTVNRLGHLRRTTENSLSGRAVKQELLRYLSFIFPFFSNYAQFIRPDRNIITGRLLYTPHEADVNPSMELQFDRQNEAQQFSLRDSGYHSFRGLKQEVFTRFPVIRVLQKKCTLGEIRDVLVSWRRNEERGIRLLNNLLRQKVTNPLHSAQIRINAKLSPIVNANSNIEIEDINSIKFVIDAALHKIFEPHFASSYSAMRIYEYALDLVAQREVEWTTEDKLMALSIGIGIITAIVFPASILLAMLEFGASLGIDLYLIELHRGNNELNIFTLLDNQLKIAEETDLENEGLFLFFGYAIAFGFLGRQVGGSIRRSANAIRTGSRLTNSQRAARHRLEQLIRTNLPNETERFIRDLNTLIDNNPELLDKFFRLIPADRLDEFNQLQGAARVSRRLGLTNTYKGYLQELLLKETIWFKNNGRKIKDLVMPRLTEQGINFITEPIFTRAVADSSGALTDGIIYAKYTDEVGEEIVVLFSIFESKSASNYGDLYSQVPRDIERLMDVDNTNNLITIDGLLYGYGENLVFPSDLPLTRRRNGAMEQEALNFILSIPDQEYRRTGGTRRASSGNGLRNRAVIQLNRLLDILNGDVDDPFRRFAQITGVFPNPATNEEATTLMASIIDYLIEIIE